MKKKFIISLVILIVITILIGLFISSPGKTKWKNETFYIVNVSPNMQIMLKQDEYKKFKERGAECFISRMLKNFHNISTLKFELPQPPKLTFYVLKHGSEYKQMSGLPFESGMGGGDGLGTSALVVDDVWFFDDTGNGYGCDRVTIGLTHELAHIILNAYPKNNYNEAFEEGWAELVPQYLAEMEMGDEIRTNIIKTLKNDDIYELEWLMDNCMYCDEKSMVAQHRKTYISMYLWMRGYVHEIEQKYGLDKMSAFNFMMKKWSAMPKFATREEWMTAIGNIIDMSGEDVLHSKKLQLIGHKAFLSQLTAQ